MSWLTIFHEVNAVLLGGNLAAGFGYLFVCSLVAPQEIAKNIKAVLEA